MSDRACRVCKLRKPLTAFSGSRRSCKPCSSAQAKGERKRVTNRGWMYANRADRQDVAARAKYLLTCAKQRAKKKGLAFELTLDWYVDKITEGRCEVTGLPFDLALPHGKHDRNPFAPSLDRRDRAKGYVQGNVQVVVLIYNTAKGTWGEEPLQILAKALV